MNYGTECINFNRQQQDTLEVMLSGRNVFVTGRAGTGKSAIVHQFKRMCNRQLVCLAPTGMAAMNIGGDTIHGFCNFEVGVLTPANIFNNLNERQAEMLQAVEVILIDEISMVRSDCLMAMDGVLRQVNRMDLPFGGKQIIVVGDFCQLPPVVTDWQINDYLESELGGIFAFNTPAWRQAQFEIIYLNTIFRQTDPVYLNIVNSIRSREIVYCQEVMLYERARRDDFAINVEDSHLRELNQLCYRPGQAPHPDAVYLCCTRRNAEIYNEIALSSLPDIGLACQATCLGCFPQEARPNNSNLVIKHGAKVMLLANRPGAYANGDIGTVVDYTGGSNPQVNVRLLNGITVTVCRTLWSYYIYDLEVDGNGKKHITQREAGRYIQLPLAPAYAQTIHKSQGRTLDAAHIVLGQRGCFAAGQLYTALTRCRDLNNLTLDRPVCESDVIVDDKVLTFYAGIEQAQLSAVTPLL